MRSHLASILVTLALLGAPRVALADDQDTVVLQSGDKIRGKVTSDDPDAVTIKTEEGATRKIPRKEVKVIEYANGVSVSVTDSPDAVPDKPPPADAPPTEKAPADKPPADKPPSDLPPPNEPPAADWVGARAGWKLGLVGQLGVGTSGFVLLPIQAGVVLNRGLGSIADFQLDLAANFTWTSAGATIGGLAVEPGVLFHIGSSYTLAARLPLDLLFTAGGRFRFAGELNPEGVVEISESAFANPTFRMTGLVSPAGLQLGERKQHHIEVNAGPGFSVYTRTNETFGQPHELTQTPKLQFEFYAGLRYAVLFL